MRPTPRTALVVASLLALGCRTTLQTSEATDTSTEDARSLEDLESEWRKLYKRFDWLTTPLAPPEAGIRFSDDKWRYAVAVPYESERAGDLLLTTASDAQLSAEAYAVKLEIKRVIRLMGAVPPPGSAPPR